MLYSLVSTSLGLMPPTWSTRSIHLQQKPIRILTLYIHIMICQEHLRCVHIKAVDNL